MQSASRARRTAWCALIAAAVLLSASALAQRVSDIRNTKHNLSVIGPGAVKAVSETQVCVFCHTPHGATPGVTPLWNRALSNSTYTAYTSSSLDAAVIQGQLDQPGGSSKLCLSCHDGTLAIGSVNVLNGQGGAAQGTQSIPMTGVAPGTGFMPDGAGAGTGFTRNLGFNLTNDHPISLSFTGALATRDGELRNVDAAQKWPPGTGTILGVRGPGYRPSLPLEPTGTDGLGQVQCATCHDPHLRDLDVAKGNQKFLRQNRFQEAPPTDAHNPAGDIICVSCHDKNRGSGIWAYSAHANPLVATQTYTATAAAQREFPAGLTVWKAACLNCHDTHTVQGARRLLREGTDSLAVPKSGGGAALEQTCYQCHTDAANTIISPSTTVPNIRVDFGLLRRMPIASSEQPAGSEVHDIGGNFSDGFIDCSGPANQCGKDFIEERSKLGVGNATNRHAECTDCHNPHRVVKFRSLIGAGGSISGTPDAAGTHPHTDSAGFTHTNIASGALRGAWGVEPVYGTASFQSLPLNYAVKRGDPGLSADTSVGAAYVTREYQICLKCHSDYGYSDNNLYPTGTRPNLGNSGGGTPAGIPNQNQSQYTNQAKEFQAPVAHKGEVTTADSGAAPAFSTDNHRSWHPVMDDTGRTGTIRGNGPDISNNWRLPWRNAVGTQTMYCTDCHGSTVTLNTTVIPNGGEDGSPWGPHGSSDNFILKGSWNTSSGSGQNATICFKCHDQNIYTGNGTRTGFWIGASSSRGANSDGHRIHSGNDRMNNIRCNWCHVAVPHGWKNKGLLVNKNDIGLEAGQPAGTVVGNAAYNQQPYYRNAMLKIKNFRPSGNWTIDSCGAIGLDSRDWMRDTCNNPP